MCHSKKAALLSDKGSAWWAIAAVVGGDSSTSMIQYAKGERGRWKIARVEGGGCGRDNGVAGFSQGFYGDPVRDLMLFLYLTKKVPGRCDILPGGRNSYPPCSQISDVTCHSLQFWLLKWPNFKSAKGGWVPTFTAYAQRKFCLYRNTRGDGKLSTGRR